MISSHKLKHFGKRERGILRAYMSLGSVSRLIEFYSQKELKLSSQASHFTAEGRGLDVIYSGSQSHLLAMSGTESRSANSWGSASKFKIPVSSR